MPYAGTLLGCEVQTQSMQPPSFTEKALRRLPSSVARESQKKSDNDCGAIFDPIEQNYINKTENDSFPETNNRLPILSTMLQSALILINIM
jgi:hypothetical protein